MTPAAFLADIRENPDDDTPRLVFADWLAEHGEEERGEFIRAQVRGDRSFLFNILFEPNPKRYKTVLPDVPGIQWGDHQRGFVEQVTAETPEAFLANAEVILAVAPVFRLKLIRLDGFAFLCDSPLLTRISELDLGNGSGLTPDEVMFLAASPCAANLRSLLLHQNTLGNRCLRDLARSPHLGKLRELYLSGIAMSDSGIRELYSGRWRDWTLLDLRDNNITADGVDTLCGWGSSLHTLWLVNNPISDTGASCFFEEPHLPSLRSLDLSHCGLTDSGAEDILDSVIADQLEMIALRGNTFRPETWAMLRAKFKEKLVE